MKYEKTPRGPFSNLLSHYKETLRCQSQFTGPGSTIVSHRKSSVAVEEALSSLGGLDEQHDLSIFNLTTDKTTYLQ